MLQNWWACQKIKKSICKLVSWYVYRAKPLRKESSQVSDTTVGMCGQGLVFQAFGIYVACSWARNTLIILHSGQVVQSSEHTASAWRSQVQVPVWLLHFHLTYYTSKQINDLKSRKYLSKDLTLLQNVKANICFWYIRSIWITVQQIISRTYVKLLLLASLHYST